MNLERFRSITRSYYRNSVGALLLFDTTNYESFEHVNDWFQEAKRQIEPNNAVFMLVGTKRDKEHLREVPSEQAQQFADYHNVLFTETSSKTGQNVEQAFQELALKIYEQLEEGKFKIQEGWDGIKSGYMRTAVMPPTRTPSVRLNNEQNVNQNDVNTETKKGCC